jgi:hypothetical protein
MKLASAQGLKQQLLQDIVAPLAARAAAVHAGAAGALEGAGLFDGDGLMEGLTFGIGAQPTGRVPTLQRSVALGVSQHKGEYRLAIRVQRPSLMRSPIVERMVAQARGEADVRMVGRIDKRAAPRRVSAGRAVIRSRAAAVPWYRLNQRPLLIGTSIGHVDVTAGTLGAFVTRAGAVGVLSNNHVLANENSAKTGDWVLQRGMFDGGRAADRVARLRHVVRLTKSRPNLVDAAIARIERGVDHDPATLRDLVGGRARRLSGVATDAVEEGDMVYKIGRTTGPTKGRVTAFELDNIVVRFTIGNLQFDDQIEIEGAGDRSFSDGGDSGALIVNSRMEAVGLLFAGGDTGGSNGLGLTYANPIATVLERLDAALMF